MENLTMTLVQIWNYKANKNVGWSMKPNEIVEAVKETCGMEPEKSLGEKVHDLYSYLDGNGR